MLLVAQYKYLKTLLTGQDVGGPTGQIPCCGFSVSNCKFLYLITQGKKRSYWSVITFTPPPVSECFNKIEWSTVSKAADKSSKTKMGAFPLSNCKRRMSSRATNAVSVWKPGLKSDWNGSRAIVSPKNSQSCFKGTRQTIKQLANMQLAGLVTLRWQNELALPDLNTSTSYTTSKRRMFVLIDPTENWPAALKTWWEHVHFPIHHYQVWAALEKQAEPMEQCFDSIQQINMFLNSSWKMLPLPVLRTVLTFFANQSFDWTLV